MYALMTFRLDTMAYTGSNDTAYHCDWFLLSDDNAARRNRCVVDVFVTFNTSRTAQEYPC